jgi:hypothetical protein
MKGSKGLVRTTVHPLNQVDRDFSSSIQEIDFGLQALLENIGRNINIIIHVTLF